MFSKEQFTTVTPLSKALAMVVFIVLPFAAFFLGMSYGRQSLPPVTIEVNTTIDSVEETEVSTTAREDETIDTSDWVEYRNQEAEILLRHPPGWHRSVDGPHHPPPFGRNEVFILNITPTAFDLVIPSDAMTIVMFETPLSEDILTRTGVDEGEIIEGTIYNKVSYESIEIDGIQAVVRVALSDVIFGNRSTSYFLNRDGRGWSIRLPQSTDSGRVEPVYLEILSTFEFLD